ncbi:two component transcriptional regulator, LytTR family [Pseudobutyrivibrio sp. UC1225]|uniref:LytR/AlgR family response regulator transcription factor n=1 Tax=Pseudobutyrivibrio sp. UC1225 TaxID=1798185 RepID=UPI0008E30413|nr:LytTR family DNA-binding domain-containing protein [Pseudobutyrivibrio sp. UC1225]SFO03804.1 two component transcriptional regulator, LytTR family [Pseudobutyrivibrio sp. UC1225]
MRIILCDDDEYFITELSKLLVQYFKSNKLQTPEIVSYYRGDDLLKDSGKKDIVFLDIEMPGLNGISVGNELMKHNKSTIIFITTSFIEYLDDAMRFHVFRYLTKPIDKHRLFRNLKDAMSLYSSISKTIVIESKTGVHTVNAMDIIYVEAIGRKVTIHTLTNDLVSIHPMKYWRDTLPKPSFYQTHRSFIVNLHHINSFDHQLVYMCNNQHTAYLTRRKYTEFKTAYLMYIESTR